MYAKEWRIMNLSPEMSLTGLMGSICRAQHKEMIDAIHNSQAAGKTIIIVVVTKRLYQVIPQQNNA
jgi:hypothetical protein